MITLKKIVLRNFLSHVKTEISFGDRTRLLLDGVSGAGKSSVVDAITWTLYGEARVENRKIIHTGQKNASVALSLNRGKDTYTIERSVSRAGKHKLIVFQHKNNELVPLAFNGLRETQSWITQNLLGMSYLLFINSIVYLQENKDAFVNQSAARRKELLLEILNTEDFNEYYRRAKEREAELVSEKNVFLARIEEINGFIVGARQELGEESRLRKQKSEWEEKVEQLEKELAHLEDELERWTIKYNAIEALKAQLEASEGLIKFLNEEIVSLNKNEAELSALPSFQEINKKLTSLEKEFRGLEETRQKLQSKLFVELEEKEKERYEILRSQPSRPVLKIDDLEKRIAAVEKKIQDEPECPSGERCPFRGRMYEEKEYLTQQIKKREELYRQELASFASWNAENADILSLNIEEQKQKIRNSLEELSSKIAQYNKLIEENKNTQRQIVALQEKLKEKEKIKNKYKQEQEKCEALRKKISAIGIADEIIHMKNEFSLRVSKTRQERDLCQKKLSQCEARLEGLERTKDLINKQEQKILEIRKRKIPDIEQRLYRVSLIKEAFGSYGIRTVAIDYLLPRLEDKINEILSFLSDHTIILDTQREKASREGKVEGLFITIKNEMGDTIDFSALSGGEKAKISVAVAEALASLQSAGFRVLDEFVVALDEDSLTNFIEAVQYLQKKYPQTIAISHINNIKEIFDDRILFEKRRGVTYKI